MSCLILFLYAVNFGPRIWLPMVTGGYMPPVLAKPACTPYGLSAIQERVFVADEGEFNVVSNARNIWYNGWHFECMVSRHEELPGAVLQPYEDELYVITYVDKWWYVLGCSEEPPPGSYRNQQ